MTKQMIYNLASQGGLREDNGIPQVGDEIEHVYAEMQNQMWLAIRIGQQGNEDLWFAWTNQGGHLSTVRLGEYWRLKRVATL